MTEHGCGESCGDAHTRSDGGKYRSELTVEVEVEGSEKITVMDILKEVKGQCGEVVGCRMKGERTYEVTMRDCGGRDKIMDGLRVRNTILQARAITSDDMVVSFISLPVYMEDSAIIQKLTEWGVTPLSQIKRRKWPGTDIADGTRFLKVRFNDKVRSLPYSTKFETLRGAEYVRVIHDRQIRVCRLCIKPGHIFRECPEFKCFRCQKTGHYARECQERGETERPEREENGQAGEDGTTREERPEETRSESGSEMEEEDDGEGEERKQTAQDGAHDEAHGGQESAMEEDQGGEAGEGQRKAEEGKAKEKEKKTKEKSKKTLGGSGEKREKEGEMREEDGEGGVYYEDITDSDENKWEELIATRKRPLGRKEKEGKGKKKNTR